MRNFYLAAFLLYLYQHQHSIQTQVVNFDDIPVEYRDMFKEKHFVPSMGGPGLQTTFGGPCVYTCPNGAKPKKRKNHAPKYDGCGIPGANINGMDFFPKKDSDFTACCNDHDKCYNTCGKTKEKCDEKFKKCMLRWCDAMFGLDVLTDMNDERMIVETKRSHESCDKRANLFHSTTHLMACAAYMKAQEDACDCKRKDSVKRDL